MQITEWLIQTNQILHNAEQNLPPEYVNQLRIFQQTIMINHLQSGFLTLTSQTPLERALAVDPIARAMANDPFRNIDFSTPVTPTKELFSPLQYEWQQSVSHESIPDVAYPLDIQPLKSWAKLGL